MTNRSMCVLIVLAAAAGCGDNSNGTGGTSGMAGTGGVGGTAGTGGEAGSGGLGGMGGAGGQGGCLANAGCAATEYCAGDDCDARGECVERPVVCPLVFDPVCGCDDTTYDNDCFAAQAGARVDSEGVCPCAGNDDCAPNDYCASDASCEAAGTCEMRPVVCPLVFDPVCGCDDTTYDNSCFAAQAGARVAFEGPCT